AANRAARIIRSGSSLNEDSGAAGVRIDAAARSARPPYGSTNVLPGMDTAIALTVKSRRIRSPSSVSPNATAGLRLPGSYASERNVVTSITQGTPCSITLQPTVPNSLPIVHTDEEN